MDADEKPMPPPSRNRPVSRGAVGMAAEGRAVSTDVTLSNRPISSHGLEADNRVSTSKRQVFDGPYYVLEIKNRIAQCAKESELLQNSTEELSRREVQFQRLSDTLTELRNRVQLLQGEFTDINYAKSQLDSGASLEDLRTQATAAEQEAEQLRENANTAFKARQDAAQRLERNEVTAARLREDIEQRILDDLGASVRDQYVTLSAENAELSKRENELRTQLETEANLTAAAYANASILEGQQGQQNIEKAIEVHRQLREFEREIEVFHQTESAENADPEYNIKQQLRNQIKQESNECKQLVEEIKTSEQSLQHRMKILQEIQPDVMTQITKEEKEMLKSVLKAERELSDWPRQRSELTAAVNQLQERHLHLLNSLPTPTKDDNENLDFKLSEKTRELERISDQDAAIQAELREVSMSVQELRETLIQVTQNVNDAEKIENVEEEEKKLKARLNGFMEQHQQLSKELATIEKQMTDIEEEMKQNESVQTIRTLFQGFSQALDKQYKAEAYIKSKQSDGNYEYEKKQCVQLLTDIDKILKG